MGMVMHFLAWASLGLGLRAEWTRGGRSVRAMGQWYVASLGGFALGLATLPIALGRMTAGLVLFPFVPSVFAPVVFAHAAMFAVGAQTVYDGKTARWMQLGSAILIAIAVLALALQGFALGGGFAWTTAGWTWIGYALVAAAWSRQYSASRRASPLPSLP